jgi:hypothetical protein
MCDGILLNRLRHCTCCCTLFSTEQAAKGCHDGVGAAGPCEWQVPAHRCRARRQRTANCWPARQGSYGCSNQDSFTAKEGRCQCVAARLSFKQSRQPTCLCVFGGVGGVGRHSSVFLPIDVVPGASVQLTVDQPGKAAAPAATKTASQQKKVGAGVLQPGCPASKSGS